MLVGFDIVAPDAASGQPLLWPGGITAGSAEQLNMTDVRVVVRSQEVFNKYLEYFTSRNVLLWTVSLARIASLLISTCRSSTCSRHVHRCVEAYTSAVGCQCVVTAQAACTFASAIGAV